MSDSTLEFATAISKDLAPFADVGTLVDVQPVSAGLLRATWTANLEGQEATFRVGTKVDGIREVRYQDRRTDYRGFLGGPNLGNLKTLSSMLLQAWRSDGKLYVESRARTNDPPVTEGRASAVLLQAIADKEEGRTPVVMVTAEPGAGKTQLLKSMVRDRALAFSQGRARSFFFYVDAQGSALAKLMEAFSLALARLKASFQPEAIAVLAKYDLLVPVIDGFDELIGAAGYSDAFGSLSAFVESLEGEGALIAAARSAYYEQEFASRAIGERSAGLWRRKRVTLLPWGDEEFGDYLSKRAAGLQPDSEREEGFRKSVRSAFEGKNARFREKPFFVAKVCDFVEGGAQDLRGADLLPLLATPYFERERERQLKAKDSTERFLLSREQLERLLVACAREMWHQETRELSMGTIQDLVEIELAGEVSDGDVLQLRRKGPSLAGLKPIERVPGVPADRGEFEHEQFFSFFLAKALVRHMTEGAGSLRGFLSRSVLPSEVAFETARQILGDGDATGSLQRTLDLVAEAGRSDRLRVATVRENGGRVAQELLKDASRRVGVLRKIRLAEVVVPGGDLEGVTLEGGHFARTEFKRVDFRRTAIRQSVGTEVFFLEPFVDQSFTRLEIQGVDPWGAVVGVRQRVEEEGDAEYDPTTVAEILNACGLGEAKSAPAVAEELWAVSKPLKAVVTKMSHAYMRTNIICEADDTLRGLVNMKEWPTVLRLAIRCEVVSEEIRPARGSKKAFYRREVRPDHLLAGESKGAIVPPSVVAFWRALAEESAVA